MNKCVDCGKSINKRSKRCRVCSGKYKFRKENNPSYKDGRCLKPHLCVDCNKEITRQTSLYGKGRCASCARKYTYKINPTVTSGKNNGNWVNDRNLLEYSENFNERLKNKIRHRDNYICQNCGIPEIECNRKLDIHHIDYDKKNTNEDNLISLCRNCHSGVQGDKLYWREYFYEKLLCRL